MKVQTRLSSLIFVSLLTLTAGATLVLSQALSIYGATLQSGARAQISEVHAQAAKEQARLSALALEATVAARLTRLEALVQGVARSGETSAALTVNSLEAVEKATDLLDEVGARLRFIRMVDLNGQLVLPPTTTTEQASAPALSLVEAPAPNSVAFQSLIRRALEGNSVTSLEIFPADLVRLLSLEPLEATPANEPPRLMFFTVQPVLGLDEQVKGAIVAGRDLELDRTLIPEWYRDMGLSRGAVALLHDDLRVAVAGEGLGVDTRLAADLWQALSQPDAPLQVVAGKTEVSARVALRNHRGQGVGAVEVSVPVAAVETVGGGELAGEELLRRSLTIIGLLAILLMTLGILVTRGVSSPLARLSARAEALSTGDLETSFKDVSRSDELGELARALERVRISLKKLIEGGEGGA